MSAGVPERPLASYTLLRHRLGIAEGVDELPVGKAMALENNAEWTDSVSFDKVLIPGMACRGAPSTC